MLFAESQLGLQHIGNVLYRFSNLWQGDDNFTFSEITTQSWQRLLRPTHNVETNTLGGEKLEVSDTNWRLGGRAPVKSMRGWTPSYTRWRWRGLTKQWLNHHVLLLPKIWPGARAVPPDSSTCPPCTTAVQQRLRVTRMMHNEWERHK